MDGMDDDPAAGCSAFTACVCGKILGADRVGNMPVLCARRRPGKPTQLLCIMGPFWPCLVGVTYPLILGVSLFSVASVLPTCPTWVVALWAVCTVTLVGSLALTACSDPGIVRRHREAPPTNSVSLEPLYQTNAPVFFFSHFNSPLVYIMRVARLAVE